jgi:hypothetical protein
MDAQLWHDHARIRPRPPEPLSAAELSRLSQRALDARKPALQSWVSRLQLQPPANSVLTRTMSDVVEQNRRTPPGAKTILGITAPNTAGKSTLVRSWACDVYRSQLPAARLASPELPAWKPTRNIEADYVPVVWMNLQAGAARKEFNAQLLNFLGHSSEGYLRATNERVATTISRQGVRLVVVDDIHLLRTQHRDGQTVLDHLKYINTALGEHHATLVVVGADLEGTDIAADPQIAGRMRLLELPRYPIDTPAEKDTWRLLLDNAEKQLLPYLPHAKRGFLVTRAGLIWRRTQGYLGDLGDLLRQAAHQAITSETWDLDPAQLGGVALSARAHRDEASLVRRPVRRPRRPKKEDD